MLETESCWMEEMTFQACSTGRANMSASSASPAAHSSGQPWMNFVSRAVFADPLHEGRRPQSVEANAAEARYEGIFGNVMQQVHPEKGELLARFSPGRAAELDQEKARHRRLRE